MAQTACSRLEPHPKLFRATKIVAFLKRGWLSSKSGFRIRFGVGNYAPLQLDMGFTHGDKSSDDSPKQAHVSVRVGF